MISDSYKNQLEQINGKENFGKRKSLPKFLEDAIQKYNPQSILDFGCGVGSLINTLQITYPKKIIKGYDPGNKDFADTFDNQQFDMVISTDVLEHVEPQYLDETLKFLKTKSNRFYHLIALAPSRVTLPDGRNAHLILETADWWKSKFVNLGYSISFDRHMFHKKNERTVNKYFIVGHC